MLKVLFRKDLMQFANSLVRIDKKTGVRKKNYSMLIVYVILALSLGSSFLLQGFAISESFMNTDYEWFYFTVFAIPSFSLMVVISMFSASAMIFNAKDNDILLSMPISTLDIILSRVASLMMYNMFYGAVIFFPAIIVYNITWGFNLINTMLQIIVFLIICFIATALSLLLGYILSYITVRLKTKSYISSIIGLAVFLLYIMSVQKLSGLIESLVMNGDKMASGVKSLVYPLYALSNSCLGDIPSLLFSIAFGLSVFVIAVYILNRKFTYIATATYSEKKKNFNSDSIKEESVGLTLLKKEFKKLFSSSTYLLNAAVGPMMSVGFIAYACFDKTDFLASFYELGLNMQTDKPLIVVIAAFIVMSFAGMTLISASSISLEGKNIWILKSLPLDTKEIFNSKINLHLLVSLIPGTVSVALLAFLLDLNVIETILVLALLVSYSLMSSSLGLMLNLLHPNLSWTNEAAVIKRGMPVMIVSLMPMAISMAGILLFVVTYGNIPYLIYLALFSVIFVIVYYFLNRWMNNKGAQLFNNL